MMETDDIIRAQASPGVPNAGGVKPKLAAGCLYLFAAPFCGFGLFALMESIRYLLAGNLPQAAYGGIFGIAFCGVGFGLIYLVRLGTRTVAARDRLRAANPDRPWLWREDWTAGNIPASTGNSAAMLVVFAVLCFVVSAPGGLRDTAGDG